MTAAGWNVDAEELLKIVVKQYQPQNSDDLKAYLLSCWELDHVSRQKLIFTEISPAQAFVRACSRGFRPKISTPTGELFVASFNDTSGFGGLNESERNLFVGSYLTIKKPANGMTRLVSLESHFDSSELGKISYCLKSLGLSVNYSSAFIYIDTGKL